MARRRACSFLLGLIVLYGTLASPLDRIGEQLLFSAHMLQHILLIYPVSLLLLVGLPVWFLQPLLARPGIWPVVRGVTHPVLTCVAFTVVFAVWHIPGLYEWALRDRTIHDLEHLSMLGIGFLMWWPLCRVMPRFPQLPPGVQMLYLLALTIGQIPLFAYLTFAPEVLYPTYAAAPRLIALSPLEDQQLGGILMKVASMIALFAALAVAFWRWYQHESTPRSRHDRAASSPRVPTSPVSTRITHVHL
jgi:putative membrane protein